MSFRIRSNESSVGDSSDRQLPFVGAVLQPGRRLQVVHRDLEGSLVVVEANDKDLVLGDEQPPWWEEGIAIAAEAEDSSVHRREEDIAPDTEAAADRDRRDSS
jgi:hypothetical protein